MFLNLMIIDHCLSDINRLQGTNAEKVIKEEMFALNNKYFDAKSECSRKKLRFIWTSHLFQECQPCLGGRGFLISWPLHIALSKA